MAPVSTARAAPPTSRARPSAPRQAGSRCIAQLVNVSAARPRIAGIPQVHVERQISSSRIRSDASPITSASDVEQSLGSSARNRRDYPPQIAPTVIPRPSAIRDRAWSPTATGSRRSGRHVRPAKAFSEFAIVPGPPTIDAGPSVSSFSASLSRLLMAFLEGTRSDVGSSALARFGISRIVYSHFN